MKAAEKPDGSPAVLRVRDGTVDDLPFILEQERRPDFRGLLFDWSIERHREALSDPSKRYRVAIGETGALVGFCILGNLLGKNPIVIRLAAAEEGKGVGSALLRDAIDSVFSSLPAPALYLDVFPDNARAIRLYEKFGFKEAIQLRRATTINGEEKPLMVMALERPK